MKKIMLLPALCFVLCLGLLFLSPPEQQAPPAQPEASEQPRPEEDAPPFLVQPEPAAPLSSVGDSSEELPAPLAPQQAATPLAPDSPNYYKEMFLAIADNAPPNQELQDYVPEQVRIDGRHLYFTADNVNGQYLSGRAESMFGFLYGSITFRINVIDNPGIFPAVWMLPARGGLLPEIDIYELIGRQPESFYGVLHYLDRSSGSAAQERDFFRHTLDTDQPLPDSCTIRFDWTEDSLTWYLDGQQIYSITENVPQIPMYLIFNLAVGGTWCGDPTPETVIPVTLDVEVLEFHPQNIYTR